MFIVRQPDRLQRPALQVSAYGSTLDALVTDLDRQYPGLRFRIIDEQNCFRPHIRFFVNGELIREPSHPIAATDEIQIVQALSGG